MSFTIGKNFHIIHMTDDIRGLDLWYYDVFSVRRFMPEGYLDKEMRDASLVMLGDLCVEPLAPAFRYDGWNRYPLGKFFTKHGRRIHSLAWYVDDGMSDLFAALHAEGVEMRGTGGMRLGDTYTDGPVFTHPKYTITQLEFIPAPDKPGGPSVMADPRYKEGWSPAWWADYHPLQILQHSHTTVTTHDLAKALDMYVRVLRGTLLHESDNPGFGTHSAYVLVGHDWVVELAQPTGDGLVQADMEEHHESAYAMNFRVRSLATARRYLALKGVKFIVDDGTSLVADPDTTWGVVFRFTEAEIPNDPRPSWSQHVEGEMLMAAHFAPAE
ncbi:MAG: hypothetical protein AB7L13_05465 [Acidimicrobiia bacterium]